MAFRVSIKRVLVGLGLSAVFTLQITGQVASGRWSLLTGVLFGLLACGLSFWTSLTYEKRVESDEDAARKWADFRKKMWLWVTVVLATLMVLKLLDVFQVPWEGYVR